MPGMSGTGLVSVAEKLAQVEGRIQAALRRAGRSDEVLLVAVSKSVPVERIAEGYRAGLRHFGENRLQEFEEKRRLLTLPSAVWHMVGHLQSNKARRATEIFDRVDALDNVHTAAKLSAAARGAGRPLPVLIQVKLGEEATKSGVAAEELEALLGQISGLEGLEVRGLMTLPPLLDPPERVRPYFRRLRELAEELRRRLPGVALRELSMGMSHDFEVAIEEGATQVRLGTALFGERPER